MKAFLAGVLGALFFTVAINAQNAWAQAAISGVSVDVLAALVGRPVVARDYSCSATSGTACLTPLALGSHIYLDPNCTAYISGDGAAALLNQNLALAPGKAIFTDNLYPTGSFIRFNNARGISFVTNTSLTACGTNTEVGGLVGYQPPGEPSRLCLCTSDGGGTPVYTYINLLNGTIGTNTTCPAS